MTRILSTCTALFLVAAASRADEIVLTNGDQLSGKIAVLTDGRLTLQSPLLGEFGIPLDAIAKVATAEPIEIHLADGSVVRDRLVLGEPGTLVTAGTGSFGPQTLSIGKLTAINPPLEARIAWHPDLMLSAELERGNTIQDEADLSLKALRESPTNRVWFLGTYEAERNTDRDTHVSSTSERKIEGELKYDEFLGERWYWFARAKARRDGPADLDLVFAAGVGPGYRVFKSQRTKLDLELAPTWASVNFGDDSKDLDSAALLASWRFTHRLVDAIEIFSDLDWLILRWDDQFYVDSSLGVRSHLSPAFYLESRIEWDYRSKTSGDVDRQDVDYIFGLGYKF